MPLYDPSHFLHYSIPANSEKQSAMECRYYGWLGLGNVVANGHPSGGLWRQFWYSPHKPLIIWPVLF
jgi:hypothetical protein